MSDQLTSSFFARPGCLAALTAQQSVERSYACLIRGGQEHRRSRRLRVQDHL